MMKSQKRQRDDNNDDDIMCDDASEKRTRDMSYGYGYNGEPDVYEIRENGHTLRVVNSPIGSLINDPTMMARAHEMARRVAAIPQSQLTKSQLSAAAGAIQPPCSGDVVQ